MTRREVETIIKRYFRIEKAIKNGVKTAIFYIGHRRQLIEIDEKVKCVMSIIEDIYRIEQREWFRKIIKGITHGYTDIRLIQEAPIEKNGYYKRKQKFFDKVYQCCIAKQLVSYEDIINEAIA